MKIKSIYIVFLFAALLNKGFAQDTLNSAFVEQKSFQLYVEKNWKELIEFGNKAIDKGYNYYYLQMRIGIACYEKKNYSSAEGHFKKALEFNSDDALALEYLYYCFIFNGRNEDARWLSKQFGQELAQKIGTDKQSSIGFITIEGGIKKTDSTSYYNIYDKAVPIYYNPATYLQIGLNHFIKRRISLFHAATYYGQKSLLGIVSQLQYYLKASIPLNHNFLISPSFHYINSKSSYETTTSVTDTLWPPGVPPHSQPPPGAPPFKTNTTTTSSTTNSQSHYFVGSLAIQKTIQKFVFSLGTTVSNMYNVTQFNHFGFVSYAVFGNSKLVLGCTGYAHTSDNYFTTSAAIAPFIYIQPIKHLSVKLNYFLNNNKNIIEDNGYMVNNSTDLTKSRWGVIANYAINKHLALYGVYQLENKYQSTYAFNYNYNVIVGGVKITP